MTQAYCVKCRKQVDIQNPKTILLKNKSLAITGTCTICDTKVFRFIQRHIDPVGALQIAIEREKEAQEFYREAAARTENKDGKKLLALFGIEEKLFCDVFNGNLRSGVRKNPRLNNTDIGELLKTGIGEGYHIIHKMSGKILSKKMDKSAMEKASRVGTATVFYGGKGGNGKRIDIEMESPTYKFKLNLRDTQGKDGYPTRLMCDFTTK